jgi:hypothetical protein
MLQGILQPDFGVLEQLNNMACRNKQYYYGIYFKDMNIKNLLILLITIVIVPQAFAQYIGGSGKVCTTSVSISEIAIKPFTVVIQLFGHSPHCNSILNYTNNSQQCASL